MRERNKFKSYGSFEMGKSRQNKNLSRKMLATLVVVVFVLGLGSVLYKHAHQSGKISQAITENLTTQIPGWWLQQYFGKSVCDTDACKPDADPDKDGLTNSQEFFYHTDPQNAHTVKDKKDDGDLVAAGFDPSKPGHLTFDQASSQDSILGESLVFNQDVRQLINQSIDPNNASLPLIMESDMKLTHDNSKQSIINYVTATKQIFAQDFPSNAGTYVENTVKAGDETGISKIQSEFAKAKSDLKNVPVPDDFVQIHKYTLALLQVLPDVISQPSSESINDPTSAEANLWYSKTQAAFSLYQKIDLETKRLQAKYENAK